MVRLTHRRRPEPLLGITQMPGMRSPSFYALATDKVRYVGDPIAMVVAEDRYIAEDALELIVEDIEMLDPIVTYEDALDPAKPPLFEEFGDNIAFTGEMAHRGRRRRLRQGRSGRSGPRCRSTATSPCRWSAGGSWPPGTRDREHLTIHSSTQSPHMLRMLLPPQIGVPMEQIRVLAGDVGGGFGLKNARLPGGRRAGGGGQHGPAAGR